MITLDRGRPPCRPSANQPARAFSAPATVARRAFPAASICEILKLIAEGVHTKEIAYRLKLSAKTVESHRAQIMERLGIRDVAGLVRLAIRAGLISSDS